MSMVIKRNINFHQMYNVRILMINMRNITIINTIIVIILCYMFIITTTSSSTLLILHTQHTHTGDQCRLHNIRI